MNTQTENIGRDALSDRDVFTEGPKYNKPPKKTRIKWYRCRVSRETLRELNKRSDLLGFAQTLGFLGVLGTAAGAAIYASRHWPWYITLLLVFINGHFWHFLVNGFHELVHDSVFKTRWLNRFFLRILSFLGWHNHHLFWASHTEHHKYTLHAPDDQEVVLPQKIDLKGSVETGHCQPQVSLHTAQRENSELYRPYQQEKSLDRNALSRKRSRAVSRLHQMGARLAHRPPLNRGYISGLWILGCPAGHHISQNVRIVVAIPLQLRTARWAARQGAGFSPLLPHDLPQSHAPISLLAYELPHRAPHVRCGSVLQTRTATQTDQTRNAPLHPRLARNVETNCRDFGQTGTRPQLPVHRQTARQSARYRTTHSGHLKLKSRVLYAKQSR